MVINETWKPVVGYEGIYEISSLGNVKSLSRYIDGRIKGKKSLTKEKILKPALSKKGYLRVLLSNDKKTKNISIHRLVASAFVQNLDNLKFNQVNHIDGNKLNNHYQNLEWCDIGHNNRHARKTGLNVTKVGKENHSYGLKNKTAISVINTLTGEIKPICEASKEYPWTRRHFTMMINGERSNKTTYKKL